MTRCRRSLIQLRQPADFIGLGLFDRESKRVTHSGLFQFATPAATNDLQRFYRVSLPWRRPHGAYPDLTRFGLRCPLATPVDVESSMFPVMHSRFIGAHHEV